MTPAALASLADGRSSIFFSRSLDPEKVVAPAPEATKPAESAADAMRGALKFYADGSHFNLSDDAAWDTVSGEPQNWWCDSQKQKLKQLLSNIPTPG